MRRLYPSTLAAGLLLAAFFVQVRAHAQKSIGTVPTADASVSGVLETSNGTATIVNNGVITAQQQTATVTLARGGMVNVCTTSTVHLSQSTGDRGGPLLLSLDRGALELNFLAATGDAVLTPDMRLQPATAAPLDLRIRVVANGDTCVEDRGTDAPALIITDAFGESSYILHPRQHVLFEHGSLKEVVDNESSPCGCPPAQVVVSVAEGGVSSGANESIAKAGSTVATTADTHPFPEAESEGLAPAAAPLKPATGHVSTDVALTYNSAGPQSAAEAPPAKGESASAAPAVVSTAPVPAAQPAAPAKPVVAQAPPPPPPPTNRLAHAFVRFYRWVFHRKG